MPLALPRAFQDRPLRLAAAVVGGVLLVFVLAGLALLAAVDAGTFNGSLARTASRRLKRPVTFEAISTHLLSADPRVVVTGLKVGNPPWAGPANLLEARRVDLTFGWLELLAGRFRPTAVILDAPVANLVRATREQNNWSSGKGNGGGGVPGSIRTLRVTDGRFTFDDKVRDMRLSGTVSYDESPASDSPLMVAAQGVLEGGEVVLGFQGARLTGRPARAPYPFKAQVQDGSTVLAVTGASDKPLSLSGFDLAVEAKGSNLADLKYLIGVGLPNSRPYRLTGRLAREGRTTRATGLKATVGASDFTGSIVSDGSKPRRMLRIDLASQTLTLTDMAAFLAHRPEHVVTRSSSGAEPKTSGGPLLKTKPIDLKRFRLRDARLNITARRFLIDGLAPGRLTMQGVLDHGRFELKPLSVVFASGRADGSLGLDLGPDKPVFSLDATVRGPIATLAPGLAEALNGDLTLRVAARGQGGSLREVALNATGRGSAWIRNGDIQKSKAKIVSGAILQGAFTALTNKDARAALPCAVVETTLGGGHLRSRRILLVSSSGTAVAEGQIDLASETMDLTFFGRPSGFKLFAVDKPLAIAGPLMDPKVKVAPGGDHGPQLKAPKIEGDPAAYCAALK